MPKAKEVFTLFYYPRNIGRPEKFVATGKTKQEAMDNLYTQLVQEMYNLVGDEYTGYIKKIKNDVQTAVNGAGWATTFKPTKGLVIALD